MSFDETYDEMIHEEFRPRGEHQAMAPAAESELIEPGAGAAERPRGLQRYRTAGLVGAGGLACAAAGALLGGLGGYFTISPAVAHPVAAPTITQDLPFAQAISNADHSSSGATRASAVTSASFSKVFGALTKGIAPFASLTSEPLGQGGKGSGKGGGAGNGTGGGGTGDGGGELAGGGVPVAIGGTSPNPVVGALTPVLNAVGSVTGALGSAGTAISSLPLPLPTTEPTTVPSVPPPSTVTPTTTPGGGSGGGGSTSLNPPLPVPAPGSTPSVTIGVSGSGSKSGLTLTLP